jgi:hypothetical protein
MKIAFKEEQKFTQWWLWLILLGMGCMAVYGMYKQFFTSEKFGDKPLPDLGLLIFSLVIFGLIALIGFIKLKTEIDQNEIRMDFFPFIKKRVKWDDIENIEIVHYGFVGGWGIRLGTAYGTVYNTSGSVGLAIKLQDGSKFLIGTQKESELQKIVPKVNERKSY